MSLLARLDFRVDRSNRRSLVLPVNSSASGSLEAACGMAIPAELELSPAQMSPVDYTGSGRQWR